MKRTIRTLIIAIIALLAYSETQAQQKIGYVVFDSLVVMMPEYDTARMKVQKKEQEYYNDLQLYAQERSKKVQEYQKLQKSPNQTPILLQLKEDEIGDLDKKIQQAQQDYQQKLLAYEQELIGAISEKVQKAVEAVAKEKGYTYVFNKSAMTLIYADGKDDLMQPVKKKLGLK